MQVLKNYFLEAHHLKLIPYLVEEEFDKDLETFKDMDMSTSEAIKKVKI